MNYTFIESYEATLGTPMGAGPIFLSTRMHQQDEGKSHPKWGRSKPFQGSVDSTTDILDMRHEDSMAILNAMDEFSEGAPAIDFRVLHSYRG